MSGSPGKSAHVIFCCFVCVLPGLSVQVPALQAEQAAMAPTTVASGLLAVTAYCTFLLKLGQQVSAFAKVSPVNTILRRSVRVHPWAPKRLMALKGGGARGEPAHCSSPGSEEARATLKRDHGIEADGEKTENVPETSELVFIWVLRSPLTEHVHYNTLCTDSVQGPSMAAQSFRPSSFTAPRPCTSTPYRGVH